MKLFEVSSLIENIAPLFYQESYDNSGLIVGDYNSEISGILLCLDVTEQVVEEAIQNKFNLIISHHPIIFKGIKKLTTNSYSQKTILKAIKNDINIYCAHTNLDNVLSNGVNEKIAQKLGIKNLRILQPISNSLNKLVAFCPSNYASIVKEALWEAGAGNIGNYDHCSFSTEGIGTFRPGSDANPFLGESGELELVKEERIEFIFEKHKRDKILDRLFKSHPYEEVAYEISEIENLDLTKGAGIIGELNQGISLEDFLHFLKERMSLNVIKYTHTNKELVNTVAVCGGSGSFLLQQAIRQKADVFITSDFKYHDFFEAENKIMICDIGHYESEIFTLEIFIKIITEKFPTFAPRLTKINTNPVNYYY
jgi:dinuclear metal center YbgI/SA1388 family protein